jgi:hypothetical protein
MDYMVCSLVADYMADQDLLFQCGLIRLIVLGRPRERVIRPWHP